MPDGVSAMRGVARPGRAARAMDLVTTAPSPATSRKGSNSRPAAEHPLAVSTGLGSSSQLMWVDRSTSLTSTCAS